VTLLATAAGVTTAADPDLPVTPSAPSGEGTTIPADPERDLQPGEPAERAKPAERVKPPERANAVERIEPVEGAKAPAGRAEASERLEAAGDAGGVSLDGELRLALAAVARAPRLLVGCDYDGTLAPIVPDPWSVRPLPEAVGALRSLADLADTTVAVISGRALRELAVMSRLPREVHLVGSHGSEFDLSFALAIDKRARVLHARLVAAVRRMADRVPGAVLEVKPASVAVHIRQAEDAAGAALLARIRNGPGAWPDVQVTEGDAVLEVSVVPADKGEALEAVRHASSATAALFVGDDLSAEEVFSRLAGPDVGIKVGPGGTLARHRVAGPLQVAAVLSFLAERRREWLHGEAALPIERLSMLANGRTVALVTPDARVCWQCVPGPASAPVLAELLGGGAAAGRFSVRPRHGMLPIGQRYLPGTMTVETRWARLTVTDYLDMGEAWHRTDLIRVVSGTVPAVVEFAPRPDFGQVAVRLRQVRDGLVVTGTTDPMVLRSPGVRWEITSDGASDTASAVVTPAPDQPVVLEFRHGTGDLGAHPAAETRRRAASGAVWSQWLGRLSLPGVQRELVSRSALTLRALCHSGTGAIMAAATTSLPEEIGGTRNWDYRHCWVRDAALTAQALVSLGSTAEAAAYLGWLHRVLARLPGPERLQPVYALDGSSLTPEAVIDTLPGYAGSRPVRIGNLADQQVQLDVFGPVVELIYALAASRGQLSDADWDLAVSMCEAVARRWHEPDHGIWEERTEPRHHVHTKVMCWVAVDRAIRLASEHGRQAAPAWPGLREAIAADVLASGWNDDAQAFTAAYGSTDLDAASLHVGISGLLNPAHERFQATVATVEAGLRSGSTVYRYRRDDGLPGQEAGFHLCTAWLVEAYLLAGRREDAEELFGQLAATAGPTGLLPEEYDPVAERSLGNHPQAYSHLGLIRCATLLAADPG
jgi:trehalose 6-phosphate phosphatase